MPRIVVPEILDSLPADDLRARRSRRDLDLVDAFLGNTRWIVRKIRTHFPSAGGIVELGAGSGRLCARLRKKFPGRKISALDLAERPAGLAEEVKWVRGDFFETLGEEVGDVCVGSLILHHFPEQALRELGRRLQGFRVLIFCEPLRVRRALVMSMLAWPFSGEVTRHDMPASIRAGFVRGELSRCLGIDGGHWIVRESPTLRGALRWMAVRCG